MTLTHGKILLGVIAITISSLILIVLIFLIEKGIRKLRKYIARQMEIGHCDDRIKYWSDVLYGRAWEVIDGQAELVHLKWCLEEIRKSKDRRLDLLLKPHSDRLE